MGGIAEFLKSLDFTEDEISARSHLSIERVRGILRGENVKQSELRALSTGLRIPLKSFAAGSSILSNKSELSLLFRDAKADKRGNFDAAREAVSSFVEAALYLLPKSDGFPRWLSEFSVREESYSEAASLAEKFRHIFYRDRIDEPAVDLPSVLTEKLNIVVSRLHNSNYEGVSVVSKGYCFIFVSPRFSGRMLFTLAHELGHLLAHHNGNGLAIFDKPTEIGGRHPSKSEAFVDAFASNLLLPPRGVARTLSKIRQIHVITADEIGDIEILLLARTFGISFEAAAFRCEQLELLPSGGARSLNDFLKKEYGSAEKRAEMLNLPPRQLPDIPNVSRNLMNAVTNKVLTGEVSVGWAVDRLGLSITDVYDWHSRDGQSAVHH